MDRSSPIIIAFRKNVKEVRDEFRREAEKRGMSEDEIEAEIENITPPDNERRETRLATGRRK